MQTNGTVVFLLFSTQVKNKANLKLHDFYFCKRGTPNHRRQEGTEIDREIN